MTPWIYSMTRSLQSDQLPCNRHAATNRTYHKHYPRLPYLMIIMPWSSFLALSLRGCEPWNVFREPYRYQRKSKHTVGRQRVTSVPFRESIEEGSIYLKLFSPPRETEQNIISTNTGWLQRRETHHLDQQTFLMSVAKRRW